MRNEDSLSLSVDKIFDMPEDEFAVKSISEDRYVKAAFGKKDVAFKEKKEKPSRINVVKIKFDGDASSEEYDRLLNFLVYFHGNTPVDIIFTKDGSEVRLDEVCYLSRDPKVLELLKEFVGEENIIIEM